MLRSEQLATLSGRPKGPLGPVQQQLRGLKTLSWNPQILRPLGWRSHCEQDTKMGLQQRPDGRPLLP